mgnify:CR=1 FL=1
MTDKIILEQDEEFLEDFEGQQGSFTLKMPPRPGDRVKRGGFGGMGGGNQRKGKSTKPQEKPGKPGQGMSGGGEKGRGQDGGQGETELSRKANANRVKKKKGTGKQGIGPKKAAGAKGKKPDAPKAGGEKQQDGETEAGETGQSEKKGKGEALKKAAIRLRELDRFIPIPGEKSEGTIEDLERAAGEVVFNMGKQTDIVLNDFEKSKWMLFYKSEKGSTYISYYPGGPQSETINSIFGNIMPASGKISRAPTVVFQYIIAIKQLLRIKFKDPKGRSIVREMNKKLERISDDLSSYYSLIKDKPQSQFDKDLVSSANKANLRAQTDTKYASNIPTEMFKSIVGSDKGKTAIAKDKTIINRQQESNIMKREDIRSLIREAFTDKVYGKYPYSHKSGEEGEPAEDYMEDWKRFCLEIIQDKSGNKAIEVAKVLIKDLELFEDVLDLAGANQSIGSEIMKKMEKTDKDMI